MAEELRLTAADLEALKEELDHLKTVGRKEMSEKIKTALSFGDLSENAEYDAAREAQARNESRIQEIRTILATARVVDATNMEAGTGARVGTIVELEDASGKRQEFALVGTTETNSLAHRISNESPAGAALIGHVVGDTVSFVTPAGKVREYKIVDIRLP